MKRLGSLVIVLLILSLLLVSCVPSSLQFSSDEKEAERVARLFLVYWERKDYGNMYDLMLGSLTSLKSKENFVWLMEHEEINDYVTALRYETLVFESDDTAYVQYTLVSSLGGELKSPSLILRKVNNQWRIDAFGGIFSDLCGDNICSKKETYSLQALSYEGNEVYCPLDCFGKRFGISKIMKDVEFLGNNYSIRVKNISRVVDHIQIAFEVKVNGELIPPSEEFSEQLKIYDNVYFTFRKSYPNVEAELFNKDEK